MGTPIWQIEGVALDSTSESVTNSLGDLVQSLYNANYTQGRVYPTLAAGATIVSANADWTLGALATIIPASTVAVPFHISSVVVETCNQNAIFELAIYQGAGDTLVSTIRFAVTGGFFGNTVYLIPSVKLAANVRIRAALASSDGAANQATITASLVYRLLS
jgi:hypothetical protein